MKTLDARKRGIPVVVVGVAVVAGDLTGPDHSARIDFQTSRVKMYSESISSGRISHFFGRHYPE